MESQIIKPEQQANGYFDGGRIIEQKPIGFSGEGSTINRLGPLFYWAWGKSTEPAEIGLHPHQGYEIITYVIKGKAYHRDTMGTESVVAEGGAQLMQTGSGVSHSEALKEPSEMFQIWFEPHLNQAITRTPTYSQYTDEQFSVIHQEGATVKNVLGNDSPMKIVTDAAMWDVSIPKGATYIHQLAENRTLAGLAIRGDGTFSIDTNEPNHFEEKDFVIIQAEQSGQVTIQSLDENLRIFLLEVPTEVEYRLFRKPR